MLLKGAYCVGEHFVDPQCTILGNFHVQSYLFFYALNICLKTEIVTQVCKE